jgi:hypothetical protein
MVTKSFVDISSCPHCSVGSIRSSVLQKKKLRLREVKWLAQGHTGVKSDCQAGLCVPSVFLRHWCDGARTFFLISFLVFLYVGWPGTLGPSRNHKCLHSLLTSLHRGLQGLTLTNPLGLQMGKLSTEQGKVMPHITWLICNRSNTSPKVTWVSSQGRKGWSEHKL